MAITYTWNVSTVDTKTIDSNDDVIFNVHWRLNAEDDANQDDEGNNLTAGVYGTQSLDTSDLSNFINFDSVDSSTVEGWVETAMGAEAVQALKDGLDAQIAELITPSSETKQLVA
jgi:hypothetical protein